MANVFRSPDAEYNTTVIFWHDEDRKNTLGRKEKVAIIWLSGVGNTDKMFIFSMCKLFDGIVLVGLLYSSSQTDQVKTKSEILK